MIVCQFRTQSTGEIVSAPMFIEQTPYNLRLCFDIKIIISVLSSFNFSIRRFIHCLTSLIQCAYAQISCCTDDGVSVCAVFT